MVHVRAVRVLAPRMLGLVLVLCLTGSRADGGHLLVDRSRSTPEAAVHVAPSSFVTATGGAFLAPRGSKAGEFNRSFAAAKTAAGVDASPHGCTYLDLPSPPDHVALRSCRRSGRSPPAV